jgi:hypothetical protein
MVHRYGCTISIHCQKISDRAARIMAEQKGDRIWQKDITLLYTENTGPGPLKM